MAATLIILLIIGTGGLVWAFHIRAREKNKLKRAIKGVLMLTTCLQASSFVLLASLPQTSSLGSFGKPLSTFDVQDPQKLLEYLQLYNESLVQTIIIMRIVIILLLFVLGGALSLCYRALRDVQAALESGVGERKPSPGRLD